MELTEAKAELRNLMDKLENNELNLEDIKREKSHIAEMREKYNKMTEANLEKSLRMINSTNSDKNSINFDPDMHTQSRPAALIYEENDEILR